MNKKQKPKIKYDKDNLCKCGKPMPIIPYYCEVCKQGSMKGKKLEEHPEYYLISPSSIKIKVSSEEIEKIKNLRARGMSLRELGQAFMKSHETIRTILNK